MRGFIGGAFDLMHPGYILMFEECKRHCDWLVIGLHINPNAERDFKNRPVQTAFERYTVLKGMKDVDEIIPYENNEDFVNLLKTGNFGIRFTGSDYMDRPGDIVGQGIVPLHFLSRNHTYSNNGLRKRIKEHDN